MGLTLSKTYQIDEISGFKTSIIRSKSGNYEYLYLMIGEKKIAKISEFYHANYKELKRYLISVGVKNMGGIWFSNRQEFKDMIS